MIRNVVTAMRLSAGRLASQAGWTGDLSGTNRNATLGPLVQFYVLTFCRFWALISGDAMLSLSAPKHCEFPALRTARSDGTSWADQRFL
jgi:hypothetical protein